MGLDKDEDSLWEREYSAAVITFLSLNVNVWFMFFFSSLTFTLLSKLPDGGNSVKSDNPPHEDSTFVRSVYVFTHTGTK